MRFFCRALLCLALHLAWAPIAGAQEPVTDLFPGAQPSSRPAPGAMAPTDAPRGSSIIGGSPRSMRPRVPITTRPRSPAHTAPNLQMPQPSETAPSAAFVPDAWSVLFEIEEQGPSHGLTWEQSVERLVQASIVLRAKALDIPQAQADVLTAGMHANPIVYFDKQLIPYRPYNLVTNPGGPAQYDLNVAYPVDLSGKRQARIGVACAAQRVVEALYQDAVRLEIDRLGKAYVDVQAAQLALRTIQDGVARIDTIWKQVTANGKDSPDAIAQKRQLLLQRHTLALALTDAEASLKASKRNLSLLLNLSSERISLLELRGSIRDQAPEPPPVGQLVSAAMVKRPDLAAYRLGLRRAYADVQLTKANVLPDVYMLYQPFTYQDNSPFHSPSSQSWAVGATVVLPIFDRNQGNIRRAEIYTNQSQLELQALEQRVTAEVEAAYDEYVATRRSIQQIEQDLVPDIEQSLGESLRKFRAGQLDAANYLNAMRDLDDLGRQYRDLLIRHRRSMLSLNTVVGARILP